MKSLYFLLLGALVPAILSSHVSAQTTFTPAAGVAEVCRLTEQQRIADAVTLVESLKEQYPADEGVLEANGTIAALVGDVDVAESDFSEANQLRGNSLAKYGIALCWMLNDRPAAAKAELSLIDNSAVDDPDIASSVSIAMAICKAATGDKVNALQCTTQSSDPTAAELIALLCHGNVEQRILLLQAALATGESDGVPAVVEPPGIHLVLPLNAAPIEPSIIDPNTQISFANRFTSFAHHGHFQTIQGTILVQPPRGVPTGATVVGISVDNSVIGVTNAAPFQIAWDSRGTINGNHTIKFAITNSFGTLIGIEEENVYISNPAPSTGVELPETTGDRLWRLLHIQPAYKVAEYDLALCYFDNHDLGDYETHILRAAALDPDYKDVRVRIHPLFVGQVPARYPVPDGTSLPSSLGLSAGSASAAGFWAGSPYKKEIALTFDDGPIPGPSRMLLDALQSVNAHATFFVVGMRAAQSPDSLRMMAADGDAVEDHTFTHPNLTQVLPEHVLQEVLRTAVVIQATTGLWPHFLRPPGGNTNPFVLATARACGMSGAFWTIDALPAEEAGSPDGVARWVISRARPGAIVLMHNGMATTVAAIPQLVAGLRQRGYQLVTIRRLAADALSRP